MGNTYTGKFTVKQHSLYTPKFARIFDNPHFEDKYTTSDYGVGFKGAKQTVIQRPKVIN